MKKKKIIIICIIVAVIICICIVSATFAIKEKMKQEEMQKTIINFKETQEYEINTELTIKDVLLNYENIEIINNDEKIDTSVLGAKEITIQYKNVYKEENEEKKIEIKIIDTQAPQFEITNKELSFEQETEINLLENVKCTDNSNEQIEIKVEGDYDTNTPGTYTIKYVAEDSSGNKVESEDITLNITEKPKQSTTKSNSTYSNNNSNNSQNSSAEYYESQQQGVETNYPMYSFVSEEVWRTSSNQHIRRITYFWYMKGTESVGDEIVDVYWGVSCNTGYGMPATESAKSHMPAHPTGQQAINLYKSNPDAHYGETILYTVIP